MNLKQFYIGRAIGFVIVLAIVLCVFALWKSHTSYTVPLSITTTAGNYGLFIDNEDNEYFSTHDANVRSIIQTYLSQQKEYPYTLTDAQNYGSNLVYYYTKDIFISANVSDWRDRNSTLGFAMYDMKTGNPISDCIIYSQAGFYKDPDILLSVSYISNGIDNKYGACLYERGAPNFTFIDLTSKLADNETLFSDPSGQSLKASIKNVDAQKKTFAVAVYDTGKRGPDGSYAYARSIEVGY